MKFADLEMSLHKREEGKYSLEMRLSLPDSDADTRPGSGEPILVEFDFPTLQVMIADPPEYGKMLAESLFVPEMTTAFAQARASAAASQASLRIRILAGPTAPEINSLYWETLRDPQDNLPLFTGENILPSRYIASADLRPVRLRPRGNLKALAASANPSNLAEYKLAPVDVAGEIARAEESLGAIPLDKLGLTEPCTLNNLFTKLRAGCDILYLAAHGTVANNEPRIWLQKDDGSAAIVKVEDIITRLRELQNPPRLIVLASCQSAGDGKIINQQAGRVLQAFGPRLAQAGIPAVIAMQGNISMESVKKFLPAFFTELQVDGQIDRALAVARGLIRDAHDFWMPVLFMRLRSGRIWYVPGVGEEGEEFEKWPTLLSSIQGGQCTPILGPGLYEPLLGSWQDMAEALAEKFHFPFSTFLRNSMPNVAQYISVNQDLNTLFMAVEELIRGSMRQHNQAADLPGAQLLEALSAGGKALREKDPQEQHKILASLPLRIYITTNYDDLMADALREAGKSPEVVICPWSERFYAPSVYDSEPGFNPTSERPLVYHLFGHLSVPDSMVLTEDDYFEFLMGFTANKKRTPPVIPPAVLRALTDSALLVLGFHLDDWSFRAFFRTVMVQPGAARRGRYSHVGVQLELDEIRNASPKRARQYLQKYFGDAQINLYWGKSQDFLSELALRKRKA